MPIPKTERLKLTRTPDRRDAGIREKIALAAELNEQLRSGTGIAELSDLLRKVVRPILVDFNNVLVDNTSKYVPNMKALAPFAELQKIGTVVVLTAAGPWSAVHRALCRSGFWTSYVILITAKNFERYSDPVVYHYDPHFQKLIPEYIELARRHKLFKVPIGSDPTYESLFRGNVADKIVGIEFMQPDPIPLIDDYGGATRDNPGIFGVPVTPWYPAEQLRRHPSLAEKGKIITLADAVVTVRQYYQSLQE